ncbi:hypothetical protein RHGRI_027128 [Rhododendron griersonianum]|uniref:Uncharacterized protein n=1 Tax=Rhododendron griersonianum TaxID=479676 RepID=A0AAV6IZC2_9ERIC|nr:hypothetical protein RHGRI_027128 [Rhododendron griersonianum]
MLSLNFILPHSTIPSSRVIVQWSWDATFDQTPFDHVFASESVNSDQRGGQGVGAPPRTPENIR